MISEGYSRRPVLNQLRLDYPMVSLSVLEQIYQLAAEGCAAAGQIRALGEDVVPAKSLHPRLPRRK